MSAWHNVAWLINGTVSYANILPSSHGSFKLTSQHKHRKLHRKMKSKSSAQWSPRRHHHDTGGRMTERRPCVHAVCVCVLTVILRLRPLWRHTEQRTHPFDEHTKEKIGTANTIIIAIWSRKLQKKRAGNWGIWRKNWKKMIFGNFEKKTLKQIFFWNFSEH